MPRPKVVIESGIMRRGFATAVVVLILTMTSWASACDLSCSLEQSHSICKLQGTAPSNERVGASLSEMAMDPNMVMPDEGQPSIQPESENGSTHLHANSCTHNPCNETSSAISKSAQHPGPTLQLVAFERPSLAAIRWQITGTALEREPPNSRMFDPLFVNLRF